MKMQTIVRVCIAAVAIAATILLVSACNDDPTSAEQELARPRISVYAGDGQFDRVGAYLPDPLVVEVKNFFGTPLQGVTVAFSSEDDFAATDPPEAVTDSDGLASCRFRLGTDEGEQHVKAVVEGDSTTFTVIAEAVACPEEDPNGISLWPENHIFIATSHSSFLDGTGSVVIEFDPGKETTAEVLETTELITDIAFSPFGDLYVTTAAKVFKVDHGTSALAEFGSYAASLAAEIEPNTGGILSGISPNGPFRVGCPPAAVEAIVLPSALQYLRDENLAAHPVTRDLYIITGQSPPYFTLWRIPWDGRSSTAGIEQFAQITSGAAASPRGMCIDSTGTIYITFSGTGTYQRIIKVSPGGDVTDDFIDLFAGDGASRWGDITCTGGKLYLIDTLNDRLAVYGVDGSFGALIRDKAFSTVSSDGERYGITARP